MLLTAKVKMFNTVEGYIALGYPRQKYSESDFFGR